MAGLSSNPGRLRKGEFWALADVSMEVRQGHATGVIGPNGSGKTTLLRLLNGILWPDTGRVKVRGKMGALLEVGAGFHPLLTGRENIFVSGAIHGMTRRDVQRRFDAIVEFADIGAFLDAPVKSYSSGMVVRLGFAVSSHCEPDVLLIDEVLAVGDTGFQTKCFDRIGELRRGGTTIILVSHNMHVVSGFAESVLLLHRGHAMHFDNVADGVAAYGDLFVDETRYGIERVCTSADGIEFHDVDIPSQNLSPGDSFRIEMRYHADAPFKDVEIDTAVLTGNESSLYFQASNRTFDRRLDLPEGDHSLAITVKSIPLTGTTAKVVIVVWSRKRENCLFWWRIPLRFHPVPLASGRNLLGVDFTLR